MLNHTSEKDERKSLFIFERMFGKKAVLFCIGFLVFSCAQAQPTKAIADKIIGVVGDNIILYSDIQNSISDIIRQGGTVPENGACLIMEQALISKILMLQAQKDSLPVSDEEVEAELDQKIRFYINQFGGRKELEEIAGKTIYQIKDDARPTIKEQKLAAAMQRKIVDNIRITPTEVRAFYDRIPPDSLPFFETELEIGQIIVYPKASREIEEYVLGEMNNYKKQLESKKTDFCQLARLVSEDPGSKDRCGQYEINRNEKSWDPVFLSTAFRLKEGEISYPVKSKFGYHIIQMVSRNGDDAVVRHILRIPPVTADDINQAKKKLDSVRSKILLGEMSFNAAASKYSDEESHKFAGPFILGRDGSTRVTIDQLDKDIVAILDKLKPGDISQPMLFESEQGKKGVRIIYLKSRTEPHRMNLKDDYSKVAQMALEEKKAKALDKWLREKLSAYYIMVDKNTLEECPLLQKFVYSPKGF
ncbi:MAG: peptidylprolyl isomerase [Chitinophagaceae bacterium]|nr:peptidylprolyl isomerase [Chitinophagaceae bacterium]